jgi:hypothetical protein
MYAVRAVTAATSINVTASLWQLQRWVVAEIVSPLLVKDRARVLQKIIALAQVLRNSSTSRANTRDNGFLQAFREKGNFHAVATIVEALKRSVQLSFISMVVPAHVLVVK